MQSSEPNVAFYLKYRPQNLNDLVGQEAVKKNLLAAFQNNKLSHGYLFVGPRGTGKTSTARILAKMVNCELVQTTNYELRTTNIPCNKCSTCLTITDGSNLDLIEIDAASNRGIDDIRSLRDKIKLSPTAAKKKIYIIDEVHMLTQEAFNALLKTLEEPPKHALFILATTDVGKVPQTILSRVQRLDFKLATKEQLSQALEKIIRSEKIDITEEALKVLKVAAQGSFRDAIKILDQLSGIGKKIDADEVTKMLQVVSMPQVLNLLENLASHDSRSSLLLINDLAAYGVDFKALTGVLMEIMRALILIKNDLGLNLVQPEYGSDQYPNLVVLSDKFNIQALTKDLDILQNALEKLKFTSIPQLPLELAVVEICGLEHSENSVSQMKSDKSEHQKISESVHQKKEDIPKVSDTPTHRSTDTPISSDLSDTPSPSDSSDILKLKEKWAFVLETIRPYNFSLEALLRSTTVSECNQTTIVLEVPYSFHQRILESPKNKDLLASIFSEILGRSMEVAVSLGNRPPKKEDVANVEVAQDDEIIRAAAEIFNSDTVN